MLRNALTIVTSFYAFHYGRDLSQIRWRLLSHDTSLACLAMIVFSWEMQYDHDMKLASESQQSPRINRFITEHSVSNALFMLKAIIIGIVSGILLFGISLEWMHLQEAQQKATQLATHKQQALDEVAYWKGVANQYGGYRDVYVRIASLAYSLGDKNEADFFVKKALEIDPNFESARLLEAKIKNG